MSFTPINTFKPNLHGGAKPPWNFVFSMAALTLAAVGVGYFIGYRNGRSKSNEKMLGMLLQKKDDEILSLKQVRSENNSSQKES